MTLGIDIHPVYQEHINWAGLDKNVKYIWLKVSDGAGAYRKIVDGRVYTSDSHAAGMKTTGAACGGYHYAQPKPSPESQADVLTREAVRLGLTSLAPALDLEAPFTPNAAAKDFAYRFLKRMKANGWNKVAIYSYTTMAQYLRPDLWDIEGLITWIARPGPVGQMGVYKGRTDVHQYNSAAQIAGIQGSTDADETLNNTLLGGGMTISDADVQKIWGANTGGAYEGLHFIFRDAADQNPTGGYADQIRTALRTIMTGVPVTISQGDRDAIAQEVTDNVIAHLNENPPTISVDVQAIAKAVNDDASARLQD